MSPNTPFGEDNVPFDQDDENDAQALTFTGAVTRVIYDKGFGFIYCAQTGQEYFFHINEVENCSSIDQITRGQGARFTHGKTPKGPRATSVTILGV